MSKYSELCEKLKRTRHVLKQSEDEFYEKFILKLSEYLECDSNLISFEVPGISDSVIGHFIKPGVCVRDFTITINIAAGEHKDDILIDELAFTFDPSLDQDYQFTVLYRVGLSAELNENIEVIFEQIFQKLQSTYF